MTLAQTVLPMTSVWKIIPRIASAKPLGNRKLGALGYLARSFISFFLKTATTNNSTLVKRSHKNIFNRFSALYFL